MAVAKIFWDNPYLDQLPASVTGVNRAVITVDKTIAFAFSGGQESDRGTMNGYEIINAEKDGKQIFYTLSPLPELRVGDEVLIKIDWERRYKLMRLHFAAEIILELMTRHFDSPVKIGAHIAADKARVDFAWPGNIAQTFELLQKETRSIIAADLPIKSEFADQENEIRYWKIENFARVLCGGTHIRRTAEVGAIALKRNNIGKGKERIEITLLEQT
jgi:alanyl-tRNA synthetase